MPDSTFVFDKGDAIEVGSHGEHDFVFANGEKVNDGGTSDLVFESGTGIGGVGEPSGDLQISINNTNSPVGETAIINVDADVTNNTGDSITGNIVLEIAGTSVDGSIVDIPANTTLRLNLEWQTEDGDAGDYTATVKSGTDSDSASVTVKAVDNPEEKTKVIDVSLSLSDREDGAFATGVVTSVTDIRFIEARIQYDQQGEVFGGNQQGNWGLGVDVDTSGFNYPIRRRFDQGGTYDTTGIFDLGSVQTGDLDFGVDDGDGTISEPQ